MERLGPGNRDAVRTITLNGRPRDSESDDVAGLVAELGLVKGTVLVEHNGIALRPDEWHSQKLESGDRIEMLRLAAGG